MVPCLAQVASRGLVEIVMPSAKSRTSPSLSALVCEQGQVRVEELRHLFDHLPDVVFFVKDRAGRYLAANRALAERCGVAAPAQLRGLTVTALFPAQLAARYAAQDEQVLHTGRAVLDRLELHWHRRGREGWCLTTKLPLRDPAGVITGIIGISRDLRSPGDKDGIPASLSGALEWLEEHYADRLSPALLAKKAGLSAVRFARLIKRIFRLTPGQLISQTRLAAATRMLAETGRTVAEVAVECGFYDHSAFTRAFRSATGVTPTEFRSF
jgi:PAS domain S-box-containing protein